MRTCRKSSGNIPSGMREREREREKERYREGGEIRERETERERERERVKEIGVEHSRTGCAPL